MKAILGIIEAKANYKKNDPEIESEAKRRADVCADCLEDEPIKMFQVEDRIPELSKKMFSCCGCVASWKARQNKLVCEKWKK